MDQKEIVTLRTKLNQAKEDFERESMVLTDLKRRVVESQQQVDRLSIEVTREAEARIALSRAVALGEKSERDFAVQSKKTEELKRTLQDAIDLNEGFRRTLPELEVRVSRLGDKVRGCSHEFWYTISIAEAEKIREADTGPLLRSWGAYLLSGAPPNLGPWLLEKFKNFNVDTAKICRALECEYLGKEA